MRQTKNEKIESWMIYGFVAVVIVAMIMYNIYH